MAVAETGFYITGGTMPHNAPSYVERQADRDLYDALTRGEFCYVLTARQIGKSSLMVRTAARLRQEGANAVILDLTVIGQNLTAEQWYNSLLATWGEQLDGEAELWEYWQEHSHLSPLQRWIGAIRDVLLQPPPAAALGAWRLALGRDAGEAASRLADHRAKRQAPSAE